MSEADYECTQFLPHADEPGVCDGCGTPLTGRQRRWCKGTCQDDWRSQHDWGWARNAAKRRDGKRCVRCGSNRALEVNHIEPRVGRGYGWGCHNHLSNLETLCHDCHLVVTAQQRAERTPKVAVAVVPPQDTQLFEVSP